MCGPILALLVIVPTVEIYTLVQVGRQIGALETIALLMLSAFVGLSIAKNQGLAAVRRLNEGAPPSAEVLAGPLLLLAAALLVIPGFVTDAFGFVLLVPPVRRLVARRMARRALARGGRVVVMRRGGATPRPRTDGDVIDVEVVRRDTPKDDDGEPR